MTTTPTIRKVVAEASPDGFLAMDDKGNVTRHATPTRLLLAVRRSCAAETRRTGETSVYAIEWRGVPADFDVPTAPEAWSGYVSHRIARETGTLVVLVNSDEAGINVGDPDTAWTLLCDDHGRTMGFSSRRVAESFAAEPTAWCEVCAGTDSGVES